MTDVTLACEDHAASNCIAVQNFVKPNQLLKIGPVVVICISRPLPNKTKLKFDQDYEAH